MSPRKLIALIDAEREIQDAENTRLAYTARTGRVPPKSGEEEFEDDDGAGALYF